MAVGRSLTVMVPTCRHTDCGEAIAGAAGRYCDQHAMELAVVLVMLDEMHYSPSES